MNGAVVPLVILGALLLLPLLYVVVTYNTLVALRNYIRDAWSNVDTELKRRYDLIPNLVATVKGYAAHEREVLEQVTQLRVQCMASQGRPEEQAVDENQLVAALQRLLAVVENYPQLKADQHFLQLQRELVNTEDRIQAARRFYNGNVRDYRNKCQTFPSSLVAGVFGFEPQDYFQVPPSVREVPDAKVTAD
jgi:LemA protein